MAKWMVPGYHVERSIDMDEVDVDALLESLSNVDTVDGAPMPVDAFIRRPIVRVGK